MSPARAAGAAAAVALCVLTAWVLVELTKPGPRRSGSNYVDVPHFVENLDRGGVACQPDVVPKDTGGAAMLVTSYHQPTPDVGIEIRSADGHRLLASGVLRAGFAEGLNILRFAPAIRWTTNAQLCLIDRGLRPITIGGENATPSARMSAQWFRPGHESYLSIAGLVLSRVRYGKAGWFGPWLPVLVVVLIVACVCGALYVAVRP